MQGRADVEAFFDAQTATVTYLVSDPQTKIAALIDPVLDYDAKTARINTKAIDDILDQAQARGLTLAYVLDTHAHADHLSAADHVRAKTGAKLGVGARITEVQSLFAPMFMAKDVKPGAAFDLLFDDNAEFDLGALKVRVLATPGHTPACVTYLIGDAAFVGDTVFQPDYGTARTDFPGGDAAALYRSIRRIFELPPETRVFTGHDYPPPGRTVPAWESTIAEQRAHNVHIHDGVSEETFVAMRKARDATLAAPILILPSLQVNIRAGALPPPAENGKVYLMLPVNALGKAD